MYTKGNIAPISKKIKQKGDSREIKEEYIDI
jgi:hypothetical protein